VDGKAFDAAIRGLNSRVFRRTVSHSAAAGLLGALAARLPGTTEARKKRGRSAKAKQLCHKDGSRCKKKGKKCKAQFCLRAPFTIEARWSNADSDHDTFLFVPNEDGNADPFPHINVTDRACRGDGGNDGSVYPFAFIDRDAQGPGNEITTVRSLLDGTYEYWIELAQPSAPGEVEVVLRNASGKVLRSLTSPENANPNNEIGWHVFDINGATRQVTSVDDVTDNTLPEIAHTENTKVCPA
jgi:hypothetical protein